MEACCVADETCQLVESLEQQRRDALCAKNLDALRALVHPQFVLIGTRSAGPFTMNRDEWLEAIQKRDVTTIELRVKDAGLFGNVMVGTVEARWRVQYLGRNIDDCVLLTDVWVHEDGRWQALDVARGVTRDRPEVVRRDDPVHDPGRSSRFRVLPVGRPDGSKHDHDAEERQLVVIEADVRCPQPAEDVLERISLDRGGHHRATRQRAEGEADAVRRLRAEVEIRQPGGRGVAGRQAFEARARRIETPFGADVVVSEFISSVGVSLGIERVLAEMRFEEVERPIGIQLYGADAGVMARAAGIAGVSVGRASDLADAVREGIASGKPCVIDANIDGDLNPAGAGIWELPGMGRSKPGIGKQYVPEG